MIIELGIVIERRQQSGPWGGFQWLPVAAVLGGREIQQWQLLRADDLSRLYYAGPFCLSLHPGDTEAYRENLADAEPSLFVVLRHSGVADDPVGVLPVLVTAALYDAEPYLDGGDDIMAPVPMPSRLVSLIEQFVEVHHVDRPFIKREPRQ